MRLVAGATVIVLTLSSVTTADDRAVLRLRGWIDAVDTHAAGQTDAALGVVTAWTYEDLELMRPYVEALFGLPAAQRSARAVRRRSLGSNDTAAIAVLTRSLLGRGDVVVFMKRAVILHTDAALVGGMPLVVTPPSVLKSDPRQQQRNVDVRSHDGQVSHFELQNLHWEYAMDVLEALPAKPAPDPFIGQWYRAIGAHFAHGGQFADALRHFQRARRVAGQDAGVLYGEACLQETLGAPPVQDYVRVTVLPNGLLIRGIESPQSHFRRAESLLRQALAADPALIEASLRLGRVLTRLEKYDEALSHLRTAMTGSDDRATVYYAHLFAGDANHALGRLDEARRQYEQAIGIYPDSQAARLALGSVLRAIGDRPAALSAIDPMLRTPARGPDDDPWWEYYAGDGAKVGRLLAELRAPFMSAR